MPRATVLSAMSAGKTQLDDVVDDEDDDGDDDDGDVDGRFRHDSDALAAVVESSKILGLPQPQQEGRRRTDRSGSVADTKPEGRSTYARQSHAHDVGGSASTPAVAARPRGDIRPNFEERLTTSNVAVPRELQLSPVTTLRRSRSSGGGRGQDWALKAGAALGAGSGNVSVLRREKEYRERSGAANIRGSGKTNGSVTDRLVPSRSDGAGSRSAPAEDGRREHVVVPRLRAESPHTYSSAQPRAPRAAEGSTAAADSCVPDPKMVDCRGPGVVNSRDGTDRSTKPLPASCDHENGDGKPDRERPSPPENPDDCSSGDRNDTSRNILDGDSNGGMRIGVRGRDPANGGMSDIGELRSTVQNAPPTQTRTTAGANRKLSDKQRQLQQKNMTSKPAAASEARPTDSHTTAIMASEANPTNQPSSILKSSAEATAATGTKILAPAPDLSVPAAAAETSPTMAPVAPRVRGRKRRKLAELLYFRRRHSSSGAGGRGGASRMPSATVGNPDDASNSDGATRHHGRRSGSAPPARSPPLSSAGAALVASAEGFMVDSTGEFPQKRRQK